MYSLFTFLMNKLNSPRPIKDNMYLNPKPKTQNYNIQFVNTINKTNHSTHIVSLKKQRKQETSIMLLEHLLTRISK